MISKVMKSIFLAFKDFYKDEGVFLSAALAYFSILSLIPLTMFVVNILLNITQEEKIIQFVYGKIVSFFPSVEIQMIKELRKILSSKEVSTLSLILYGFFSLQLFTAIEFSLNKIFKTVKKRNFLMSAIASFIVILFIIASVAASFTFTYIAKILKPLKIYEIDQVLRYFFKYVIPFLLIFMIVGFLYKFLPQKKLSSKAVLIGTFITTVFIEVAKHLFTFYVMKVIKISTLYGSVSTFLILLMWLFYGWAVFFYGAEVIKNLDQK